MEPQWLEWARRLQSLAQAGLAYTEGPFDRERYEALRDLAAEIVAAGSETELPVVRDLFKAEQGYLTPKVDVRGVVFQDDRVLLVRELLDGGRWTLPGGWADVTDSPREAVEREVWEESGYRARAVKLLAVYDRRRHGHPPHLFTIYKFFFLCEITGGAPATSLETAGATFFAEDALPELSLGRVTPSELTRLFEHHRHPEWPTDFD